MWWWSYGLWWPGLVLMAVLMVICFVVMALMMRGMGSAGSMGRLCGFGRELSARHGTDADRILNERLARGEIDVQEHRRIGDAIAKTSVRAGGAGAE